MTRKKYEIKKAIECTCLGCGETFMASHKDAMYCSDRCYSQARAIGKIKWQSIREYILERDNFTCQQCHAFSFDIGLAVHHIKPLFRGGSNDLTNLLTLCHQCHRKVHKL